MPRFGVYTNTGLVDPTNGRAHHPFVGWAVEKMNHRASRPSRTVGTSGGVPIHSDVTSLLR